MAIPSSLFLIVLCSLLRPVLAAFGISSTANGFRVDTAAGLVFEVSKFVIVAFVELFADLSRSNGDITSLLYHGIQYQASDKGTQINSGLG